MDSRQRYTEVERPYEYDEGFIVSLRQHAKQDLVDILRLIEDNAPYLPKKDGWVQEIGGVLKGEEPLFFMVEFLHQDGEPPLFLDLTTIDCDSYLDYIIEDSYLIDTEK